MPSKAVQQVIVAIVAAVGLVLGILATGGRSVGTVWPASLKVYSISVTVVGLVFLAHNRWLWRIRYFRFGRPLLDGTWRGKLTSTYVAANGEEFKDLPAHLLVRQTFNSISVTLMSDRSESESTAAQLRRSTDGRWHVSWTYLNVPRPGERASSALHQGACDLVVGGARGERLQGRYFTDRRSDGELVFDKWSAKLYADAHSASLGADFVVHTSFG